MSAILEPKYQNVVTDMTTSADIGEIVIDDLETFVQRHNGNQRPYISRQLLQHHFSCHRQIAADAKQLVMASVTVDELEEAADG